MFPASLLSFLPKVICAIRPGEPGPKISDFAWLGLFLFSKEIPETEISHMNFHNH